MVANDEVRAVTFTGSVPVAFIGTAWMPSKFPMSMTGPASVTTTSGSMGSRS